MVTLPPYNLPFEILWLILVAGSEGMHQDLMAELGDKSWRLGSLAASATSETVEY